jgi:AcrR family transcriptional regulator
MRKRLKKASPTRGRKPKPQRHEEILAAAFEEFAAKGYAEARLDRVATRAGIAKGTIYLYFKNKETLFRFVVRDLIHRVIAEVGASIGAFQGTAEDLVRTVLSRQYAAFVKNPKARAVFRLLIAESHKFPQLSDVYLHEIIEPALTALRALVEKGVASGEFRDTKIKEFPQVLIGPAVIAVAWTLILGERQKLDLDAYMEAHLELLLHGLKKGDHSAGGDPVISLAEGEKL